MLSVRVAAFMYSRASLNYRDLKTRVEVCQEIKASSWKQCQIPITGFYTNFKINVLARFRRIRI